MFFSSCSACRSCITLQNEMLHTLIPFRLSASDGRACRVLQRLIELSAHFVQQLERGSPFASLFSASMEKGEEAAHSLLVPELIHHRKLQFVEE